MGSICWGRTSLNIFHNTFKYKVKKELLIIECSDEIELGKRQPIIPEGKMNWTSKEIIIFCLLLCWCCLASGSVFAEATATPSLAKWYMGRDAAVSLRFDDNYESHVKTVVPFLNTYDFNGTFMVSPGRAGYLKYKDFWEKQLPAMGHKLGNHTMHHSGADDLGEADYEIGEATRIIRKAYPSESWLMVFASGGGEKWGGKDWEKADPAYRQLTEKYHLIDLYDGNHHSIRIDSSSRIEEFCASLDKIVDAQGYQPFHFHNVGKSPFIEALKALVRRYDLNVSEEIFREFLKLLAERKDELWIAPIVDIMKYENERNGSALKVVDSGRTSCTVELAVQTDSALYDHKLTMKVPKRENMAVASIFQDNDEGKIYQSREGEYLVDVDPVNSIITINYRIL